MFNNKICPFKICTQILRSPFLLRCSHCHAVGKVQYSRIKVTPHLVRNGLTYCSSNHKVWNVKSPFVVDHISTLLKSLDNRNISRDREKELRLLAELMKQRDNVLDNIKNLNDLKTGDPSDDELEKLSQEENLMYQAQLLSLNDQIVDVLVPKPTYNSCNDIILEVRSGAGGQEAMLFAGELFLLYEKFCALNGWKFIIDTVEKSDMGGIQSAVAFIAGQGSYYYLQNEIGVHRVQRNPSTEKSGRLHTSTAAVIVMPQPTEVDIILKDKDLQWEYMRASGPGGQSVNKSESAVRLKHLPSGIFVESSTSRSQIENKEISLIKLRTKLLALEEEKQSREIQLARHMQLGNRDRSEKIRTYNFPQDRVTDHRFNITIHNIKSYFEAGENFQQLLVRLNEQLRKKQCADYFAKYCS